MKPIPQVIPIDEYTKVVAQNKLHWEVYGKAIRKSDPEYRYVTSNWDLYVHRGALGYALTVDNNPVSFIATYFNLRPKEGGWGPYANNYLAYTPPQYRGHGYVILPNRTVEQAAAACGWKRSTSLAAGYTGFLYQLKSGRTFWGVTQGGELRTDTPLDSTQRGTGVPYAARDVVSPYPPHPLAEDELIDLVCASAKYGKPPRKQVEKVLQQHPLQYDPAAYTPRLTLF